MSKILQPDSANLLEHRCNGTGNFRRHTLENISPMVQTRPAQRGFTLVELIAVLIIVGILAVAALPRFFARKDADDRAFYDQVLSTLRYAQKAAIGQHRYVCVTIVGGATSSISLTMQNNGVTPNDCSSTLAPPVQFKSGQPYPSSTITQIAASTTFSFDCMGKPSSITGITSPTPGQCSDSTLVLGKQTITVAAQPAITVEGETGYVH